MTDILIPHVPDDVIAAIDAKAQRLGISRTEYLRRVLAREGRTGHVAVGELTTFAETFSDLGDEEVMRNAWR